MTNTWLGSVARFRQGAYRLLAEFLLPPTRELIRAAPQAAGTLGQLVDDVSSLAFYGSVESWLRQIRDLRPIHQAGLAIRYESIFGDAAKDRRVSLLESEYRPGNASERVHIASMLRTLYSSAGFGLVSRGGAPDHIAVELEFASLMCGQESCAWAGRSGAKTLPVLVREQLFLAKHPCNWLPVFARSVDRHDDGLYASTARAAWAMASHDVDYVRAIKPAARVATEGEQVAGKR